MRDEYYRSALAFVNRIRKAHGLPTLAKLRKGKIRRSGACPIARSLAPMRTLASPSRTYASGSREWWEHPVRVERFVRRFDSGKYPELVA